MEGITDIHTHILPGVDDGAKNFETSINMIGMAHSDGIRNIILTPHYRGKLRGNKELLLNVFEKLKVFVGEYFPDMKLYLGNEIFYDSEVPENLYNKKVLSMNESDYCLIEFSPHVPATQVTGAVSEVFSYGFVPIIAHLERYLCMYDNEDTVYELLNQGALIQLNADSVLGEHGHKVKKFCKQMLKEGNVHFIASDAHDTESRVPLLNECRQKVSKKYGTEYADKLFCENGLAVINNKEI